MMDKIKTLEKFNLHEDFNTCGGCPFFSAKSGCTNGQKSFATASAFWCDKRRNTLFETAFFFATINDLLPIYNTRLSIVRQLKKIAYDTVKLPKVRALVPGEYEEIDRKDIEFCENYNRGTGGHREHVRVACYYCRNCCQYSREADKQHLTVARCGYKHVRTLIDENLQLFEIAKKTDKIADWLKYYRVNAVLARFMGVEIYI